MNRLVTAVVNLLVSVFLKSCGDTVRNHKSHHELGWHLYSYTYCTCKIHLITVGRPLVLCRYAMLHNCVIGNQMHTNMVSQDNKQRH